MKSVAAIVVAVCAACCAARPARADEFWKWWGDGKAELSGYTLVQPRYGQLRQGTAVLIFVTEDFSDSLRVKADPGKHPSSDVYPVMKINFVRRFQTGIYDYSVLTSTFMKTEEPNFPVVKVSFSSEEWCGHVYQQWLRRGATLVGEGHSYFDGEADQSRALDFPAGGILEEQIPALVRGLRGELLHPGESRTVPFLGSLLRARFSHHSQKWGVATVTRGMSAAPFDSGIGSVAAVTWTVKEEGGDTTDWMVEAAEPHRLLGWSRSDGERGLLRGSDRLKYWELNQEGGEKALSRLGLAPREGSGPTTAKAVRSTSSHGRARDVHEPSESAR